MRRWAIKCVVAAIVIAEDSCYQAHLDLFIMQKIRKLLGCHNSCLFIISSKVIAGAIIGILMDFVQFE